MALIRRLVLTGGPSAGKSTVLRRIAADMGDRVVCVPEVGTGLLRTCFPRPGRDLTYSPEIECEYAYALVAREKGVGWLVCDRGVLDGAAYTPGGLAAFCDAHGVDADAAMARYASVLHLESVAARDSAAYGSIDNDVRYEGAEEARGIDLRLAEAWGAHPGYAFVRCSQSVDGKYGEVRALLEAAMGEDARRGT